MRRRWALLAGVAFFLAVSFPSPAQEGGAPAPLTGSHLDELSCDDCHPVPSSSITDQHPDDTVQVIFPAGTLAISDGSSPSWDGTRCSGVYCHGASLSGGSYTDPAWRGEIDEGVACGMCHGVPPPVPHVQITACESCHNITFDGSGSLSVDTHANGTVDFNSGRGNLGGLR